MNAGMMMNGMGMTAWGFFSFLVGLVLIFLFILAVKSDLE